ncbi:MAG: hypothetical protein BMS9Abin33_0925 [Gammaproteobacteria bacterium]|nr:MAG: hypothetical protein BMS9Abin33_0925 [Gammaproteobacteria bacterium]
MVRPDFAHTGLARLEGRDLRFLIENFPGNKKSYEEVAEVIHQIPTTLESMLDSDYVFHSLTREHQPLLDVSPFLLFNVLLRRSVERKHCQGSRRVVNYIANVLSLFTSVERCDRIRRTDASGTEYIVDMIAQTQTADSQRRFLIYSHIGNYSLYKTGLYARWISYRHRYQRRPLNIDYYLEQGQTYYAQASNHALAVEFGLREVFTQLAETFDYYRQALNRMTSRYLELGQA